MPHQDLKNTLGAILVGSGFAATLTGVVATQTVYYFQSYADDKPSIKLMVAVVWFLDLLHTIMIFVSDWSWLIDNFDNPGISNWIPWSLGVTIVLTAMVTFIVHAFFAHRIYRLSRGNWFIVVPILILAVTRLGLATTSCAEMMIYEDFSKFVEKVAWVFTMGLATSSILDVVITSCLLWYLDHARTGFAGMDQIVNTLCLYAVENGLLTSVVIVISLGCWLGMRNNLIFMAIHFVVAKLYANSLLATLNSRKHIRERNRKTCVSDGTQLVTVFNLPRGPGSKRSTDHIGGVQIDKEIYTKQDEEAGITLSPMVTQSAKGKDSVETSSTSGMRVVVEAQ